MAKIGGDVVMIMMLLLVSIIIYYYMNTFITLHQSTFNLLFALFSILIYQLSLHANTKQCITSYRESKWIDHIIINW